MKIIKEDNKPKKMMKSENLKLATKNRNQSQLIIKEGYLEKKYDSNIFFKWTVSFALYSDVISHSIQKNSIALLIEQNKSLLDVLTSKDYPLN